MKGSGKITKWMASAPLNGPMEGCIQDSIKSIKNRAKGFIFGQMERNSSGSGLMVSRTE